MVSLHLALNIQTSSSLHKVLHIEGKIQCCTSFMVVLLLHIVSMKASKVNEASAQLKQLRRLWDPNVFRGNNYLRAISDRNTCIDLGTSRISRKEECHVPGYMLQSGPYGRLKKEWAGPNSLAKGAVNEHYKYWFFRKSGRIDQQ